MLVGELIEALKTVDPKEDALPWLKGYANTRNCGQLSILDGGRAIKALVPLIGKPYLTQNSDGGGKPIRWRVIIWKAQNATSAPIYLKASQILDSLGIKDYEITDAGWFKIRLPRLCQFRDFKSDDPAVWEANYQYRVAEDNAAREAAREEWERQNAEAKAAIAYNASPAGKAEAEKSRKEYQEKQFQEKIKVFDEVKEKLLAKQKEVIVVKKEAKRALEVGHD